MSMIETKFHLLQVQEKLIARDPIVSLELGLGIADVTPLLSSARI